MVFQQCGAGHRQHQLTFQHEWGKSYKTSPLDKGLQAISAYEGSTNQSSPGTNPQTGYPMPSGYP